MSLISIIKKTGMAFGGLLLACNMGCNAARFDHVQSEEEGLEQIISNEISERPKKRLKKWAYPANVIGGAFVSGSIHELGHALSLISMGKEIDDFCLPFFPNPNGLPLGYTITNDTHDTNPDATDAEKSFYRIAGTIGDVSLIETINYNLRNGNISKSHQPFWATTSLVTRILLLNNVLRGLDSPRGPHSHNDFVGFEYNSGISVEKCAAMIGLYTLFSYDRIKQEVNAALGRKYYPYKKTNSRLEVIPTNKGIGIAYRKDLN